MFKNTPLLARILLVVIILTGCNQKTTEPGQASWQVIASRDRGNADERMPLYRALVPDSWSRKDPQPSESILDTMLSNCEFFVDEIRLTIHTFPFENEESRIPPQAQIARWKKQLKEPDLLSMQIVPEVHGGFIGLLFEGEGQLNERQEMIMGWSMQLAPEYCQKFVGEKHHAKKADYTIKAVGPSRTLNQHRQDIVQFAQSFELIDELPSLR